MRVDCVPKHVQLPLLHFWLYTDVQLMGNLHAERAFWVHNARTTNVNAGPLCVAGSVLWGAVW